MGGCKCTYRNCNVKTDGKTHMFHYPVFEKIRCHQWLINAHRLDFLDLKVSQLKNRVVCQHHFKDDNFMNFKKDKLTFDAIPTEDGPYCDPSNYVNTTQDSSKLYSIIVDDIENDLNGGDKKANFSLKYGDFLTNFDFGELGNEDSIAYKHNNYCVNKSPLEGNKNNKEIDESSVFYRLSLTEKSGKKAQSQPMLVVPPYVNSNNNLSQNDSIKSLKCDNNILLNSIKDSSIGEPNVKNYVSPQKQVKKEPKIRIISQKKITNPLPIYGRFQPVSPNYVLNSSKIRNDKAVLGKQVQAGDSTKNITDLKVPVSTNYVLNSSKIHNDKSVLVKNDSTKNVTDLKVPVSLNYVLNSSKIHNDKSVLVKNDSTTNVTDLKVPVSLNYVLNSSKIHNDKSDLGKNDNTKNITDLTVPSLEENKKIEIEIGPMIKDLSEKPTHSANKEQKKVYVVEKPTKKSLLHSRVPPERAEAINKKRKFNMKLKEVIESCLEKLENSDKEIKSLEKYEPKESNEPTRSPPNELSVSNSQEYTIQYLEERMRKMENTLLQKIEQNSKKIVDLKNTCIKATAEKKSNALTRYDEEAHKKQLFQEISKYLSPSSKSLVYEELFIDRFALNESPTSVKRKRGRRVS